MHAVEKSPLIPMVADTLYITGVKTFSVDIVVFILCRCMKCHVSSVDTSDDTSNGTGYDELIHTEGVAQNLKETSTSIKPGGN